MTNTPAGRSRVLAALLALGSFAASCAVPASSSAPSWTPAVPTATTVPGGVGSLATGDTGGTSRFAGDGLAFDYPASWNAARFDMTSSFTSLIVYLSSEPLSDPCDRTPTSIACTRAPVGGLSPGGVLVGWSHDGMPGWTFDATKGRSVMVGGRLATLEALEASEGCGAIGGEREMVVTIPDPDARWNWTEVRACLRGPDLDKLESRVEAMLSTVRWTP